jgi:hypothetical protein
MEEPIDLWRVIIPMRGETLRAIARTVEPIERQNTIRIGPVNQRDLLVTRRDALDRKVRDSGLQVEVNMRGPSGLVYSPLLNCVAAERLRSVVSVDLGDSMNSILPARDESRDFVVEFSNDSIRRYLRLRRRLIMNRGIAEAAHERARKDTSVSSDPADKIRHYVFLNAIITGPFDYYDKNQPENDVLNLYDTTSQTPSAYALLVGPTVLALLRRDNYRKDDLLADLSKIGYTNAEVEDCLQAMHERSLLSLGVEHSPNAEIVKSVNIVEAHWELFVSPAYTGAMALVTPVDDKYHTEMQHTLAFERTHFFDRVKTTLMFLRQLREDELTVSTWKRNSQRHLIHPDAFTSQVHRLRLPSVYQCVARSVKLRLDSLRKWFLKDVMNDEKWDTLLKDDALAFERHDSVVRPHVSDR